MIDTLISSKTRVKLLLKFFLNANNKSYLRGLEQEFGESTNAIRVELNRFEKSGMLKSFSMGNKKFFQANREHPLFKDIQNLVLKHVGFDKIIANVINKLGSLQRVYVVGAFAKGLNSSVVDLIMIGDIKKDYFISLVEKAEVLIGRRIRHIIYKEIGDVDWDQYTDEPLLLWEAD